ncbi:MAG: hypothetical protein JXB07_10845, partial [Anaerolineae bacterium]|nr:hypothetical protein [Anaerolineae bacterium]
PLSTPFSFPPFCLFSSHFNIVKQLCPDLRQSYLDLHRQSPERELYVLHTDREDLNIQERHWLGIRGAA